MQDEFQITDLLLGDIQGSEIRGIRSFEWKIAGIYKAGLELYRTICAARHVAGGDDIRRFKQRVHKHRNWMNRRVFTILSQCEIIRNDVVTDYQDFRAESMAVYQQIWRIFDALLSPEDNPGMDAADGVLKINQLLDSQNRRDKEFITPLLAATHSTVEPTVEGYADAA